MTSIKKMLHVDSGLVLVQPPALRFLLLPEQSEPFSQEEAHCGTKGQQCSHAACFIGRDGHVSLQEYMAFMISRETENVKSSEEIESAFRALSSEGKPYVTKEELYQVSALCGPLERNRGRCFVRRLLT